MKFKQSGYLYDAKRTGRPMAIGRPLRFAWYMFRNLRYTVTIGSVLVNSKTQNVFLFSVHAMFRHDCPLAVKPASTPWRLVQRKTLREMLYLLICSFQLCLSWLLRSRVRKPRRELWITLYILRAWIRPNFIETCTCFVVTKIVALKQNRCVRLLCVYNMNSWNRSGRLPSILEVLIFR
jgi:hypothetical protein